MVIVTLPKALIHITGLDPERVAMRCKDLGIWHDIRWSEYLKKVKDVALGLHKLGVRKEDHVAIIG
ncbi:MAG: long-chain fatty acid--CoA ligase, partial [Proteobacteria bacterium]|nr:long-chain fatty acid--CoA ligase [Pseudomonadota bacterium]